MPSTRKLLAPLLQELESLDPEFDPDVHDDASCGPVELSPRGDLFAFGVTLPLNRIELYSRSPVQRVHSFSYPWDVGPPTFDPPDTSDDDPFYAAFQFVSQIRFSPCGRWLAALHGNEAVEQGDWPESRFDVWDLRTNKRVYSASHDGVSPRLPYRRPSGGAQDSSGPTRFAFSPSGDKLAIVFDSQTLQCVDLVTKQIKLISGLPIDSLSACMIDDRGTVFLLHVDDNSSTAQLLTATSGVTSFKSHSFAYPYKRARVHGSVTRDGEIALALLHTHRLALMVLDEHAHVRHLTQHKIPVRTARFVELSPTRVVVCNRSMGVHLQVDLATQTIARVRLCKRASRAVLHAVSADGNHRVYEHKQRLFFTRRVH